MESVEHDRASHAGFDLENLFEVSPDAIFVTDNRGVIRAANPRAVELFGHTEDELVGQPIEFLIPSRYHSTHPAHRENF
jgi:PAS domain S-box-containing protein